MLLLAGLAHAGACCVGATSPAPTRLGPCEHVLVGVSTQAEGSISRWDSKARVRRSSLSEGAATSTLALGVGLSRRAQLGATVPVLYTWKRTPSLSTRGGGLGDARFVGRYNVVLERMAMEGERARPGVWLTAGGRLPSGRDHTASDDLLLADVTGLPGAAVSVGAIAERTQHRFPWLVVANTEADREQIAITGVAGIGRTFGPKLTGLASVGHTTTVVLDQGGVTDRTWVAGRFVAGRPLSWRGWAGFQADLPIPGLGREQAQRMGLSTGLALIR